MLIDEQTGSKREVSSDEQSHFDLVIRVRHDEMAQWSQERLATFFEAVGVLMAAKTQSKMPSRPPANPGATQQNGENLEVVEQRMKRIEQTVDSVRRHVATLHESIAEDFKTFEDNLTTHNTAIQSARTAMSQTDDLVERVVEALEVLQTSTLRGSDENASVTVN